jgi:hypothetical protein
LLPASSAPSEHAWAAYHGLHVHGDDRDRACSSSDQHLTKAGWSVAPRRLMEWMSQALIACVILFVLLIAMSHDVAPLDGRARSSRPDP